MHFSIRTIIISCLLLGLSVISCIAQDSIVYPKKSYLGQNRNWQIDVPVWILGLRGNFSQGGINIDTYNYEAEEGDRTLQNLLKWLFPTQRYLEFYFASGIEFQRKKFYASFDAFTGKIGGSVYFKLNDNEVVQASVNTVVPNLVAGYRFYEFENRNNNFRIKLIGYGGLRYSFLDITSRSHDVVNEMDLSQRWGDMVFGLKVPIMLHRWKFILKASHGGIGLDNSRSSVLSFDTSFRAAQFLSIKLGWKDYKLYHKYLINSIETKINLSFSGPVMGICFHI